MTPDAPYAVLSLRDRAEAALEEARAVLACAERTAEPLGAHVPACPMVSRELATLATHLIDTAVLYLDAADRLRAAPEHNP